MFISREDDYLLYEIIQKIICHKELCENDMCIVNELKWKIKILNFMAVSNTQRCIMIDVAGKLFYIDKYIKGGL